MAQKETANLKNLVIVESPAKAKTISKYLGPGYTVKASIGHIVDLPARKLGVAIENNFQPEYQVLPEKKKVAKEIMEAAKKADQIFLAPDPDREGEAIAWHIANLIAKERKPVRRVLINEITRQAVKEALAQAGDLDKNRFEAQQARRILDRLVGYQISPLLWRKIKTGLSAGRVQSVAVRLICERENAIQEFKVEEYWSIEALLKAQNPPEFTARLIAADGEKIKIADQSSAEKIEQELAGQNFSVARVEKKERQKKPPEPFITARLQQEAAKRLGFPAKKTMAIAQQLYEGIELGPDGRAGLITYMRTDSVRVSSQAIEQARAKIRELFGDEHLPARPNIYKSRKEAQEAHEAIRPTLIDKTPEQVKAYLTPEQFKLYKMIYERFLASQMKPALFDQTSADIRAGRYTFRATGSIIKFPGFLALWQEPEKNKTEDENGDEDAEGRKLPQLAVGEILKLQKLDKQQHFTQPPPRYNEASLIRELEEKGIGRPSTYAQIVSTIQERKYVEKVKGAFHPTELGCLVNNILTRSFPDLVNVKFTASMEDRLDLVEEGKLKWDSLLQDFYKIFAQQLKAAPEMIEKMRAEVPTNIPCPKCGKQLMVKWGRQGEFLGCSAYPACDFTANFVRKENGEIEPVLTQESGLNCPECGKPLLVRKGKRGEFLGCAGYPKCKFTANFQRTEAGEVKMVPKTEPATAGELACPKCGKPLLLKQGRRGEFLGCSAYPKCRFTSNFTRAETGEIRLAEKTEVAASTSILCEKCGKPMVIKRGRKGEFLGCSAYPDCRNTKNFRRKDNGEIEIIESPADASRADRRTCPQCGKPLAFKTGKYGPFLACSGYPECKFIQSLPRKKSAAKK